MAYISIAYRVIATNETEAQTYGAENLEALSEKVLEALKAVEQDCKVKYPDLGFDFNESAINADELIKADDRIIWEVSNMIEVRTTHPNSAPETDYSFGAFDCWQQQTKPLDRVIYEPLRNCDWSSIKPFIVASVDAETLGNVVMVSFSGIKAIDYGMDIQLIDQEDWL